MQVRIDDYSEYDSRLCRTGGSYGYWEIYSQLPCEGEPTFEVSYFTTSEFAYCKFCGSWLIPPVFAHERSRFVVGQEDDCGCGRTPQVIGLGELQRRIKVKAAETAESPNISFEIKGELE